MAFDPSQKAEGVAGLGTLLSAVAASACCIGPIVTTVLGLGGASYFQAMEPYRPYLVGLALLLLAFYVALRRLVPPQPCACPPVRSKTWRSVALGGGVAVLLGGGTVTRLLVSEAAAASPSDAIPLRAASFRIEGITCGSCEVGIRLRLRTEAGVRDVKFEGPTAHVTFDPAAVSSAQLADAIRELGYRIVDVREASDV